MGWWALLNQMLTTIQGITRHIPDRNNDRPGNEPDVLNDGARECLCQTYWDINNPRRPFPCRPAGEEKEFYLTQGVALYKATVDGDWNKMQEIWNGNEERIPLCSSLNDAYETALHVAVGARQVAVVQELVSIMTPGQLEVRDRIGNTAFCVAVATDSVDIAEILMDNNPELPLIRGARNKTPLYIAAVCGNPKMIRFLFEIYTVGQHIGHLNNVQERGGIFSGCIHAGLFDLAIQMLNVFGDLAWEVNSDGETAFGILARKPSAFSGFGSNTIPANNRAVELMQNLWREMSSDREKSFERTIDQAAEFLFEAARLGNYGFLEVLIGFYPGLVYATDVNGSSIFHIAVLQRHAHTFKLIHKPSIRKDLILEYRVKCRNERNEIINHNMLQLAAKRPSSDRLKTVSGAALQMQWELLWFREVENITPPSEREKKDVRDWLTPRELFTKEHEELRKAGEEWMKSTANSGMIVATIITTVVFTTASSLPGGTVSESGTARNTTKPMFHVFIVSDTIAMCSSIVSTIMFLSILTSRYAEEDFLVRLPTKLAVGLIALLLSLMALMVSFSSIIYLAYPKADHFKWVPILAYVTSGLPAALFLFRQYRDHLLHDLILSASCYRCLLSIFGYVGKEDAHCVQDLMFVADQ